VNSSTITAVQAWESLDSRGRPTVAAQVVLADGSRADALVPSGASAGSHEACELRDGGLRYGGRGVLRAVSHVQQILGPAVQGHNALDTRAVDEALTAADPSAGHRELGANAVLAVSLAAVRAAAAHCRTSLARHLSGPGSLLLPMPMVNIISGGAHAGGLLDVQDFLIIPHAATSFAEAIRWCAEVRDKTAAIALSRGQSGAVLVADEGGLGLPLSSNRAALELLSDGITAAGFRPGHDMSIALDIAATELFDGTTYSFASEKRGLTAEEWIQEICGWVADFPIVSIEDILAEDDWPHWTAATARLGEQIELIGDDLFVTQRARLLTGIGQRAANSVLVKVNQNGTVTGAADVLATAQAAGYRTVVSARSGETEDRWLADLAVGWRAGQIKVGSTHRSERTAKWNRLLKLEALEDTVFAGPWSGGRPSMPTVPSPAGGEK